jgi:CrcB protein
VSLPLALGIGALGGIGALARFLLDAAVADRFGRGFPLGTLAVNLTGALALGVLVGAALSSDTLRLVGTGLIGSYTTFSTWVLESQRLGEDGQAGLGALNFLVSVFAGLAVAWLGRKLGMAL